LAAVRWLLVGHDELQIGHWLYAMDGPKP